MPPAKGTCSTPQIETKTKKEQHNEQHTAWRKLRVGLARCLWPHHAANHAGGGNESEVPLMTQGVGNAYPGRQQRLETKAAPPPAATLAVSTLVPMTALAVAALAL